MSRARLMQPLVSSEPAHIGEARELRALNLGPQIKNTVEGKMP